MDNKIYSVVDEYVEITYNNLKFTEANELARDLIVSKGRNPTDILAARTAWIREHMEYTRSYKQVPQIGVNT